jgi:hypothetical protein
VGCHPVAVVTLHLNYVKPTKFKAGGLHEKHVVATWNLGGPSQHLLIDKGKPRKTCVEMAGRRTFHVLTSSEQSGIS